MILRFYPKKDATIYENYPSKNTGLDAILDVSKVIVNSSSYNSRVLIDFDYTAISASIVSLGHNPNAFKYNLKAYLAEASEIPLDYTLYCFPAYNSWSMGVGRYGNSPETTDGVSWRYRDSAATAATAWLTSSFPATVTASWSNATGGGTWYTSSAGSQSFSYTTSDIDMDVTAIIRQVQSGSFTFNGFIIKKSENDEKSTTSVFNSLKFFSKDTHTVYSPIIEAKYDDSITAGTLNLVNTDDEINVIAVNMKSTYAETSTPLIRFSSRYRYPADSFTTSSGYLVRYRLPSDTQYAVYNANSDDIIVNFSEYTKLSDDTTSSYLKLHLDSFQPQRYYRLLLKVPNSGSNSGFQIYDDNWIFKVTRNQ